MRLLLVILFAVTCSPAPARAQSRRDDGLRAFVSGDYVMAAQILRPLAEDTQAADPTAQFLMAALYDAGYGGQGGTLRACAMYASAAAAAGPFTAPATVLARMIREELGRGAEFCRGGPSPLFGTALIRGGAASSSGAGDGLVALSRSDYSTAAALLQPLGESDTVADPAAQFLMGALYHGGGAGTRDPLRACALYHRAATADGSPFGAAASRLMRGLWREHDNRWFAGCQALGNLGLDHRFEPVTFDLAPGHFVEWDFAGATVTYKGETTEFPWRVGQRGAAYLPVQHTMLRTGPARERRDFIEIAVWQPSGRKWQLEWHLLEIAGSEVRHITSESGLLTSDRRPPPGEPADLRALVTLRVNSEGLAEWARVRLDAR